MTLHKQSKKGLHIKQNKTKDFTLKYKRYAKCKYMSPTGTSRTNKETNDKLIHKVHVMC